MFTNAQKARLKALIIKSARTSDEEAELTELVSGAKAAGYEYDTKTGDAINGKSAEGDNILPEEKVRAIVNEGVTAGLKSLGFDAETLKGLKAKLAETPMDAKAISEAVRGALGGQGAAPEFLTKAIKDALPANMLDEAGVKKLLDSFKDDMTRSGAKMLFATGAASPIEHRSGNLTVGQKQLLNICLAGVTDEALRNSDGGRGVKRPTGLNDGISDEQLRSAQRTGEMQVKSIRESALRGIGAKALTTTGAGTGLEFVNTDLSSELMSRLYMESQLAAIFTASEIQMPTDPFKIPMSTTRPTFRLGSQAPGSDPASSDPGTGDITLTTGKLIGISDYSYEADEDAIIAMLPFLQNNLATGAAESLEGAIVNGDTTATHMDSDTNAVGATAYQKIWKGLRKLALAGSSATSMSLATGGISAANAGAMRKLMKKYGIKPADLFWLVGVAGYNDMVMLDETLTADKAGPNAARILTGVAPSLLGIPIIASAAVREDLNASGVYDGTTTTKGSILLVHRPSFLMGVKRGFTIEVETDKKKQVNSVIASFRRAFQPVETPSATVPNLALGYNYTA